MAKIKIYLLDEVNAFIEGITEEQKATIIDKTKVMVKGAHNTASYKMKLWDGKESFFDDDGFFFQYMIPEVIDILKKFHKVKDVDIIDERTPFSIDIPDYPVDKNYLIDWFGSPLQAHQVDSINSALRERKGIIGVATSGGKSWICLGICRALDKRIKTFICPPSEYLINQYIGDFKKTSLNFVNLGKVSPDKRKKAIEDHDHIILTHKLLMNIAPLVEDEKYVIIYDEAHRFGDETATIFRSEIGSFPFRIGLTGSLPADRHKRLKIINHFGNDELVKTRAKTLIEIGMASKVNITMVGTKHPEISSLSKDSEKWDWQIELDYLTTNRHRIEAIYEYIQTLSDVNTLIVCRPEFGNRLSQYFNGRMIIDSTPIADREAWLNEFYDHERGYVLCASFGTSSTGISINNIQRVISIDAGIDDTTIKQTIGRAMRKDSKGSEKEFIDIYSDTRIGMSHKRDRKKLYESEKHPVQDLGFLIKI